MSRSAQKTKARIPNFNHLQSTVSTYNKTNAENYRINTVDNYSVAKRLDKS